LLLKAPIAIHHRPGSFSDRWIEFCRDHAIPHVVVNAYWTDIIDRLRRASAFLWHIAHGLPADMLMGRHVLEAAEQMGLVVFPN